MGYLALKIDGENIKVEGNTLFIKLNQNDENPQTNEIPLSSAKLGQTVNEKYILVAHFSDRTSALVSKDCLKYMKFGKNNNFAESDVYEWLNTEYLKELEKEFGENSVKIHETNLLSLDGLEDYGEIENEVSLLTINQYRMYRKYLKSLNNTWWLSSPNSTDSGTSGALVECVSSDGNIVNHNCKCLYCGDLGVRPYFIIDSSTLVNVN